MDIDEAPRRLTVAKLFDQYEGTGFFDHVARGLAIVLALEFDANRRQEYPSLMYDPHAGDKESSESRAKREE